MKKLREAKHDDKKVDGEEEKDLNRKEGVEKRKRAKKADKQVRWSGLILLVIIMLVGFLMWVSGEVNKSGKIPKSQMEQRVGSSPAGKVIIR